jgi:hypothetical protein
MEIYIPMAVTERHSLFSGTFSGSVIDLLRRKEIKASNNEIIEINSLREMR